MRNYNNDSPTSQKTNTMTVILSHETSNHTPSSISLSFQLKLKTTTIAGDAEEMRCVVLLIVCGSEKMRWVNGLFLMVR